MLGSEFIATTDGTRLHILYMCVGDVWHRFYLDAGILFWGTGRAPNHEDDLGDGEEYFDLLTALDVSGIPLGTIVMSDDCRLLIPFSNGAKLLLHAGVMDVGASIEEMHLGAADDPTPDVLE